MRLVLAAVAAARAFAVPAATSRPAAADPPAGGAVPKDKVKMDDDDQGGRRQGAQVPGQGQQDADGSWGNTAITGFALLAFMSNGHVPEPGRRTARRSPRASATCSPAPASDGYLVGPRGGNMYCHGMATLALTQVYGMTGDEDVKKVAQEGHRPDRQDAEPRGRVAVRPVARPGPTSRSPSCR